MPFPIIYQGKILFRNGVPAFSTNCCCDPCIPSYQEAFYVALSGDQNFPYQSNPPDPPLLNYSTIFYKGRVRDTTAEPPGSQYWRYLWMVNLCIPYTKTTEFITRYETAVQAWIEQFDQPSSIGDFGLYTYNVGLAKDTFLVVPEGEPLIEDLFGPIAPIACRECCEEKCGIVVNGVYLDVRQTILDVFEMNSTRDGGISVTVDPTQYTPEYMGNCKWRHVAYAIRGNSPSTDPQVGDLFITVKDNMWIFEFMEFRFEVSVDAYPPNGSENYIIESGTDRLVFSASMGNCSQTIGN